ncbi:hypothetical protein RJ641_000024 [Dillenia turbinata]|uniref:Uncharacterized protein n=1 Tax=Dillenia turbinata TaxID=194707 RepID=A0AAN8UBZ9_9MAGN
MLIPKDGEVQVVRGTYKGCEGHPKWSCISSTSLARKSMAPPLMSEPTPPRLSSPDPNLTKITNPCSIAKPLVVLQLTRVLSSLLKILCSVWIDLRKESAQGTPKAVRAFITQGTRRHEKCRKQIKALFRNYNF